MTATARNRGQCKQMTLIHKGSFWGGGRENVLWLMVRSKKARASPPHPTGKWGMGEKQPAFERAAQEAG